MNKLFCAVYLIAINMFRRGSSSHTWNNDFDKVIRAKYGAECKLTWMLVRAIKFRDPYMVSKTFMAMSGKSISPNSLGVNVVISVLESLAWVKSPHFSSASDNFSARGTVENRDVERCIRLAEWRLGATPEPQFGAGSSIYGLGWPALLLDGAAAEISGKFDCAEQSYREALKLMPNWLAESKAIYDKLNFFLNDE